MAKIVLVMFLWAVCFPLIAAGLSYAPHLTFAGMRAVLAGAVLLAMAVMLRRPWPRGGRVWAVLAGIGIGATSMGFLGMFHAAEFVSPGIATVIANTQPLMAAFLAGAVLRERLDRWGWAGLVVGLVGIVVIAAPGLGTAAGPDYLLGIAYIILAAVGITVSNVLIKRLAGAVDPLMAMGLQLLIGAVPLLVGAWIIEDPGAVVWSPRFIASLVALSLLGTALVYVLWMAVLRDMPLNRANAFSFLIPVFGLIMGGLFFGETIGPLDIAGIALTLVGISLVNRPTGAAPSARRA